jgi:hypothetical protein
MVSHRIPSNWTLKAKEISPCQFRVTAKAADGRLIEITGTDEDSMTERVAVFILESDAQVAELRRKKGAKP